MARINFILLTGAALTFGLSACRPSLLYVKPGVGTVGEIPRDGRGEPLWSAIRAAPGISAPQAIPVTGGIPITPPPGYPPQP